MRQRLPAVFAATPRRFTASSLTVTSIPGARGDYVRWVCSKLTGRQAGQGERWPFRGRRPEAVRDLIEGVSNVLTSDSSIVYTASPSGRPLALASGSWAMGSRFAFAVLCSCRSCTAQKRRLVREIVQHSQKLRFCTVHVQCTYSARHSAHRKTGAWQQCTSNLRG